MDVRHLRYFLAVVDHGGVHSAATALSLTQPTVSQAVRTLERDLGTPLFFRIGRGMVPTPAGEALVGSARRVLRGMSAAEGAVPDQEGQLRGRLDIACLPAVSTGTLPLLVTEFHRRHPRVTVSIGHLRDADRVRTMLRRGRCDLAVTHLPYDDHEAPAGEQHRLESLELGSQEFWIAYPAGVEIPAHDPISWDEMPAVPLVIVPRGGSHAEEILRRMAEAGALRRPAATLQNRDARMSYVLAGVGGAFLDRSLANLARARGAQVRAFDPPLSRPFGMVYEHGTTSAAAAAFIDLADELTRATGADQRSADARASSTNA